MKYQNIIIILNGDEIGGHNLCLWASVRIHPVSRCRHGRAGLWQPSLCGRETAGLGGVAETLCKVIKQGREKSTR